jgi:RNA polymerase sigma-70 factor (ECF subfamily)
MGDSEIRARLAAHDASALEMIWHAYSSDLLAYLIGFLCSRHEAEDTLQDVFVTISQKRDSLADARKLKPYLFRLARNVALNRIKKNRRMRKREQASAAWLELDREHGGRDQRTLELEAALAAIPEKQRSVIVLKFFQDKTFHEIGEMLSISENTAGSRYGLEKLREKLKESSI